MRILATSIIINLFFTFSIFGADFRNLDWGVSQQEVIALNGEPFEQTENKDVFGTLTQTLKYKDDEADITYDLLFRENLLTNATYTISTDQKLSADEVHTKFRELSIDLDEVYEYPPLVVKMDNSTKKIVYEDGNTKVMIIYFNIPIKADYVNRTAYLKVSYSNADIVLKAEVNNRRIDRRKGVKSK
ncbi:MAG: hypothetical protein ACR2NW_01280 [Thermodesulfobacteriota bacterium]